MIHYYLAEIFITHRKTWLGWMPYDNKLSIQLVAAINFAEAHKKTLEWAEERMKELGICGKYKYKAFTTPAI